MRLIDADAIEHCLVIGGRRHGKTIISEFIRRAIQTAPTVDAVPVIRCKDCENHGTRTNMCDIWHRNTNGDGYCHRAKAKSKEQNAKSKTQ